MREGKSRILVVDDELVNRDILARRLTSRGYLVETATDGQRGLDLLRGERYDLVLLDIMMPVMDGLTALQKLRLNFSAARLPVIMTTARDGSEDVVAALGAGANDYVTKPIDFPVLLARMDTQLRLKKATEELAAAYERIKREIEAAARIQRAQIPTGALESNGLRCLCRYLPCDELAGDILNYFPVSHEQVAVYLLDVSGHGAGAALLSSGLSRLLSTPMVEFSLSRREESDGRQRRQADQPDSPAVILARLNRRFPIDPQTSQFFTIIYAVVDPRKRLLRYASAGHPGVLLLDGAGATSYEGSTGLPVGIVEEAGFVERELQLSPGSRALFFSDGVIEARNHQEKQFGIERLAALLEESRGQSLESVLDKVIGAVQEWSDNKLQDDVSLVGLELD